MKAHFYSSSTGLLSGRTFTTDEADETLAKLSLKCNTPIGHAHVLCDGHLDHLSKRVDITTGEVVDYQPPQPSDHHEWNDTTKRWVINAERQAKLDAHQGALAQIDSLEKVQNRFLREVHLGVNVEKATARLKAIEEEIVKLRKSIMQELLPQGDMT